MGHWNAGHDALAAASVWLDNVAREGKRVGDRLTVEPVLHKGDVSLKELQGMSQPVRRLIANTGALTARELQRAKKDQELFKPLSKEELEMKTILQLISEKAAQRFSSIRSALRHLDADCDGSVDRSEVRHFFRGYNFTDEIADKFFDYLDEEKLGELDYAKFVNFIRPFLEGAINGTPLTARDLTKGKGALDYVLEGLLDATEEGQEQLATFDAKFQDTLRVLARKVQERFGSLSAAFRHVDLDRNGIMTRNETRYLFRLCNIPEELANKYHSAVDTNGSGEISFQELRESLAPYISTEEFADMKKDQRVRAPTPPSERTSREATPVPSSRATSKERAQRVPFSERARLRKLMQDVGDKLLLKFRQPRDAFKPLNLQRLGRISRDELCAFFRGFGHPQEVADWVYDLLKDGRGDLEYTVFMSHFESILGRNFRALSQPPVLVIPDPIACMEVNKTVDVLKRFLMSKCSSLQEAYRLLDANKDGKVTQAELRAFAKKLGVAAVSADQLFHALDVDGVGCINFLQFTRLFPDPRQVDPGSSGQDAWTTPRVARLRQS